MRSLGTLKPRECDIESKGWWQDLCKATWGPYQIYSYCKSCNNVFMNLLGKPIHPNICTDCGRNIKKVVARIKVQHNKVCDVEIKRSFWWWRVR